MNTPLEAFVGLGSAPANQWQVSADACSLVRAPRPPIGVELDAKPKRISIDLARTALIVIDMQNDFCHPQGWLASIGVDVQPVRAPIAALSVVLPALRSAAVPVLWVNWGNRPDRINLSPALLHVYKPDGRATGLGDALASAPPAPNRNVLEKGSWGAQVVEELAQEPSDIRIDKFRMSGFFDTCLDATLRNLDVRTLLFAGVNADQCVLATLMDANFLGYDCVLLQDCTATTSPQFCWEATLYNVRQCFGFTAPSTELL
jgi:nicotinamidase-related amidase